MSGQPMILEWVNGEKVVRPMTQEETEQREAAQLEMLNLERFNMKLTFAQLLIGLVSEQWITVEEARQWRDRVTLPAQVQGVIQALPIEQQFAAETRALAPSEVLRNDPLVAALGQIAGKTPEELDNFFRTYSEV